MRNGLRLFENFTGLFLEARVGEKAKPNFLQQYRIHAGKDAKIENSFMVRTRNGWPGATDLKMYFEAPLWVVESIGKLGFRVVERQIDMDKYEGGLREYTWKVSSNEFFWWLVDYGYKLGKNNSIPFNAYQMKKSLRNLSQKKQSIFDFVKKETENPVVEERLLATY